MAESVFQGLAGEQSLSRRYARNMDRRPQSGKVLFHSTFENGFDGWRDHYGFKSPYPPVSLTSYPVFSGAHALLLSTPDLPYAQNPQRSFSSYKNLTRFFDTGLVSFSGYFTHGSGRKAFAWSNWGIGVDTQKYDDSSRGFYKLVCRDRGGSNYPAWYITDDSGNQVVIPNSGTNTAGENENKFNFDYVRLTIDLSANGGLGGYHEAQINNKVFDLTTLGAGRGLQTPQAGDMTTSDGRYASYAGGLNCGIFGSASSLNPDAYPAMLVADELMCTLQD